MPRRYAATSVAGVRSPPTATMSSWLTDVDDALMRAVGRGQGHAAVASYAGDG